MSKGKEFIPHDLINLHESYLKDNKTKCSYIIHPFTKFSKDGIQGQLMPIKEIPKFYQKNKVKMKMIRELVYRDTYAIIEDFESDKSTIKYYRKRFNPVKLYKNSQIERYHKEKVDEECFPNLKKYHSDIKRYEYSLTIKPHVNLRVYCDMSNEKKSNEWYLEIEIQRPDDITIDNINSINNFLKKYISQ